MNKIVRMAFRGTAAVLRSEIELVPLNRWNESVLRYHFCRFLAIACPEVEQFVECGRIDLVLRQPPRVAFIEFKLYRHARRFDPYDERLRGFKGGPSRKNVNEFQECIDQLHRRPSKPHLSKYVILAYADPKGDDGSTHTYSHYYNNYRHSRDSNSLRQIECIEPLETINTIVRAHLYEVA